MALHSSLVVPPKVLMVDGAAWDHQLLVIFFVQCGQNPCWRSVSIGGTTRPATCALRVLALRAAVPL